MFSDLNRIKLEINNKKISRKLPKFGNQHTFKEPMCQKRNDMGNGKS